MVITRPGFAKLISNNDKNVLIYWEGNRFAEFFIIIFENIIFVEQYTTDKVHKLSKQGYL
jgi:hypothetical protein